MILTRHLGVQIAVSSNLEAIWCRVPLSHCDLSTGSPELQFELAEGEILRKILAVEHDTHDWFSHREDDHTQILCWKGLFAFAVTAGQIFCHIQPAGQKTWWIYGLNHALAVWLQQKDVELFHGTAVVSRESAHTICLIGDSCAGKSTLARHLITNGYFGVTDDVIRFDLARDEPAVYASLPQLKLTRESQQWFDPHAQHLHSIEMIPDSGKYLIPLLPSETLGVAKNPVVFFLQNSPAKDSVAVKKLSPREAFFEFSKNLFNELDLSPRRSKQHFTELQQLASRLDCWSLSYPRRFDLLQMVGEAIIDAARSRRANHLTVFNTPSSTCTKGR